ncbi:hypothetical protein OGAPHI_000254 [Ogataea philodendri]|uniref:Uncharacterized protein n=1 Tax=Ogataea philodendri TaxID=1378263 RepID=A0A9P8TA61_9ASCO|nr:uncharacterized protein OGAPHI_000254 [Ogataea philodendri]KAH3671551.1 hypothetical protein OGAPHI_000254 [Ogataea philodendri]
MWRKFSRAFCSKVGGESVHINVPKSPSIKQLQELNGSHSRSQAFPNPRQLKSHLDKFIIGQDHCKKVLSVSVYNHYIRISDAHEHSQTLLGAPVLYQQKDQPITLEKSNILLLGPSGSGKTLAARTLAEVLNVPLVIQDCTSMTQAGYVGEDVESCVTKLLAKAGYDVGLCQRGIIVLDEIDKLAKPQVFSGTKDIGGEGVQQALLKLIEGTNVSVTAKKGGNLAESGMDGAGESYTVDTSTILFIGMGAFSGLDKIVKTRLGRKRAKDVLSQVEPVDLEQFGLIPELIGRVPVISVLNQLTVQDLERILTEPYNSIVRQYEYSFAKSGVRLAITKPAIKRIAETALKNGTGARGLRGMLEKVLLTANYECPESGITFVLVDEEVMDMDEFAPKYFSRGDIFRFLEAVGKEDQDLRSTVGGEYGIPNFST